jgi:hypothetical protein
LVESKRRPPEYTIIHFGIDLGCTAGIWFVITRDSFGNSIVVSLVKDNRRDVVADAELPQVPVDIQYSNAYTGTETRGEK